EVRELGDGNETYQTQSRATDANPQEDSVTLYAENLHEHDTESGEGDERPRHHQAETRFLSHDQIAASRRSRSISSTPKPASFRTSSVCSPRVGGSRSSPGLPCSRRKPAPTSR